MGTGIACVPTGRTVTAKPTYTNADEPEHRIAVVVFATVRAVDYRDGASIVESALRKAIRDAPGDYPEDLPHAKTLIFEKVCTDAAWRVPVTVHSVRELTTAAGNGYVTVAPSGVAYRGAER